MNSAPKIPSKLDWGDYKSDLDQKYAYKMFFGKSLEQAMPRFEACVIEACDELRFMPIVPFRYYMLAFRDYVISDRILSNYDASDAASCFIGLVNEKLHRTQDSISPIMHELMPALEYVAKNQSLFNANVDIYGDFHDKLVEIKAKLSKSGQMNGKI